QVSAADHHHEGRLRLVPRCDAGRPRGLAALPRRRLGYGGWSGRWKHSGVAPLLQCVGAAAPGRSPACGTAQPCPTGVYRATTMPTRTVVASRAPFASMVLAVMRAAAPDISSAVGSGQRFVKLNRRYLPA